MKKQTAIILVFGIAITVSAYLLLFLVGAKNSAFWISFAFLELSLVFAAATTIVFSKNNRFSFPFEISLITFSCFYIVCVIVVDLLFGWLLKVEIKVYLCIHLIVLAVFFIVSVLMLLSRKSIAKQNETAFFTSYGQQILLGEVDRLKYMVKRLPDEVQIEAASLLSELDAAIRFSDLISDGTVSDIDNRIRSKVFSMACELDNLIEIRADDITAIKSAVSEIEQLIESRNLQIRNEKIGI